MKKLLPFSPPTPSQSASSAQGDNLRPVPQLLDDKRVLEAMSQLQSHPEIDRLLSLMWRKDPDTYRHCHRVADWAQWTGGHLGLDSQERLELYICALLHDIGKLMTPTSVLKKPGALSNSEFALMKLHSSDSGKVVRHIQDLGYLESPIRGHHERIDGKGYPDELRANQIHIYSKLILVCDTFDAMTSDRVYRKGLTPVQAYEELERFSGQQFDPDAAQAFIKAHESLILPTNNDSSEENNSEDKTLKAA
jgi:HD-GYP domain-containing protein (c-di-GMP phosphodiesterase class II)